MAELQFVPFVAWSAVTGVLFVIVGLSYRLHVHKKKADPSF